MNRIKIEINNSLKPKTYLIWLIFATIMFIFLFGITIRNYITIKNYVKIDATIVDSGYRYIGADSDQSKINFIKVEYNYNNNTYRNELRISDLIFKYPEVGDKHTILINPNNPNEIDNHYIRILFLVGSMLTFIITIFLFKAYRFKKVNE